MVGRCRACAETRDHNGTKSFVSPKDGRSKAKAHLFRGWRDVNSRERMVSDAVERNMKYE